MFIKSISWSYDCRYMVTSCWKPYNNRDVSVFYCCSTSNTVNAQPITPVQPTLSSVTQPTCSVATGSFSITNYDAFMFTRQVHWSYDFRNTVDCSCGKLYNNSYFGVCTSVASASTLSMRSPLPGTANIKQCNTASL
jgi:hypothetical protein